MGELVQFYQDTELTQSKKLRGFYLSDKEKETINKLVVVLRGCNKKQVFGITYTIEEYFCNLQATLPKEECEDTNGELQKLEPIKSNFRIPQREKAEPKKETENMFTPKYTPYQRFRIELVREKPIQEVTIGRPRDVYDAMYEEVSRLDREYFWVLCLDQGNRVIGINLVSIGTLNHTYVHPREVFKPALLVGSTSVIFVHNHPSGSLTPSSEDIKLTNQLMGSGDILGIKVLDHVIIAGEGFYSMQDKGYLHGGAIHGGIKKEKSVDELKKSIARCKKEIKELSEKISSGIITKGWKKGKPYKESVLIQLKYSLNRYEKLLKKEKEELRKLIVNLKKDVDLLDERLRLEEKEATDE